MKSGYKIICFALAVLSASGSLLAQAPAAPDSLRIAVREASDTLRISIPEAPREVVDLSPEKRLSPEEKISLADSLRKQYKFRRAETLCSSAIDSLSSRISRTRALSDSLRVETQNSPADSLRAASLLRADSLLIERAETVLSLSERGLDFSEDVAIPTVVARQKFSVKDFFLYYPLPDNVWHSAALCPGLRDSLAAVHFPGCLGNIPDVLYMNEEDEQLFFSTADTLGNLKIASTHLDTLWTRPEIVFPSAPKDSAELALSGADSAQALADGNAATQPGPHADEIFPMLSADHRTLYFSARREDSLGGYDLYESEWSEEEGRWGTPVNLGFPYSSVDNDYLYMNTDDGRYSVFASDRGCTGDSLYVYVLEYEFVPKREKVTEADRLAALIALDPAEGLEVMETGGALDGSIPQNSDTDRYMAAMNEVRTLRASLDEEIRELEKMREEFALSDDVERRQELTGAILEGEAKIPEIQSELGRAVSAVQKIEMEFLSKGIVIDYEKLSSEASRNIVGDTSNYIFKEKKLGAPFRLEF